MTTQTSRILVDKETGEEWQIRHCWQEWQGADGKVTRREVALALVPKPEKSLSQEVTDEEAAGHYAAKKQMSRFPTNHACTEIHIRQQIEEDFLAGVEYGQQKWKRIANEHNRDANRLALDKWRLTIKCAKWKKKAEYWMNQSKGKE